MKLSRRRIQALQHRASQISCRVRRHQEPRSYWRGRASLTLHRALHDGRPGPWCLRALANSGTAWRSFRLISFTHSLVWVPRGGRRGGGSPAACRAPLVSREKSRSMLCGWCAEPACGAQETHPRSARSDVACTRAPRAPMRSCLLSQCPEAGAVLPQRPMSESATQITEPQRRSCALSPRMPPMPRSRVLFYQSPIVFTESEITEGGWYSPHMYVYIYLNSSTSVRRLLLPQRRARLLAVGGGGGSKSCGNRINLIFDIPFIGHNSTSCCPVRAGDLGS